MGPTIILDKSTLQGLNGMDEAPFLRRYYTLNIPPVLLCEIGADLRKKVTSPETEVRTLSRKPSQLDSMVSLHHRLLARVELMGEESVPMDGRIPTTGKYTTDVAGNPLFVADQDERDHDILRWQSQQYAEKDFADAEDWRSLPPKFLEDRRNENKDLVAQLEPYDTLPSLMSYVNALLSAPAYQSTLLETFQQLGHLDELEFSKLQDRWSKAGKPRLEQFSPYATFCTRVTFTHHVGVLKGFFGTRSKDLYDLQYVYYLPMCHVFSSSDNFLKTIVPPLMRKDQVFVTGEDLKSDLARLVQTRNRFSGTALEEWLDHYKSEPPTDSRAYAIRERLGWTRAARDAESPNPNNSQQIPFARKRTIHLDSPCLCTSGKTFRECCYKKMQPQQN